MAYEKHTWACGETITEAKLNNIEDGIEEALECCGGGGDVLFVKYDHSETVDGVTTYYFDKTWQEVHDALVAGKAVTANVVAVIDDVPSVAEGALDYITIANVGTNSKYSIASVMTVVANNGPLQFALLDSPNDYLRISNN